MFFSNHYREVLEKPLGWQKSINLWQLLLISTVSLSTFVGYRTAASYFLPPEAVFVLGGHETREKFAADLAQKHPHLDVWVSSGSPPEYVERIFKFRGIRSDRLHLDYQAQDTVTNFTTLVDQLEARGINSIYLVTSDNHMTRARIIGEIVFGSRGIMLQPVAVPSDMPPESLDKSLRDVIRSVVWLITGYTGSDIADLMPNRGRD